MAGQIFPSVTGGGLTAATSAILNALISKKQLELQGRELDQRERQIQNDERAAALKRILDFAPFLPEDSSLANVPYLHQDIKTAFGDQVDPTDPEGLGGITLNRQELADVVNEKLKETVKGMPGDSQFFQRGVARLLTGENVSPTELSAREAKAGAEKDIALLTQESFVDLMRDPKARVAIQRNLAGLETPVRLQLPDGREVAFDTEAAASISAQLWKHRDEMTLQQSKLSQQETSDIAGEFLGQLNKLGLATGRRTANEIIQRWNESVIGEYKPGKSPLELMAQQAAQNGDYATLTAIQAWTGVVDSGAQSARTLLEQTPEGRSIITANQLISNLSNTVGKEEAAKLAPSLLRSVRELGVAQINDPVFGGPRFEIPDLPSVSNATPPQADVTSAPLAPGVTPEVGAKVTSIASAMQSDAQAYASGTTNAAKLLEKWKDRDTVNQIINAANRIKKGGG